MAGIEQGSTRNVSGSKCATDSVPLSVTYLSAIRHMLLVLITVFCRVLFFVFSAYYVQY